jgi:hypothetical protein
LARCGKWRDVVNEEYFLYVTEIYHQSFKIEDFTPKSIKSGKIVKKFFIFKKSIFSLNDLE